MGEEIETGWGEWGVGEGNRLTDAAFVTALRVGDLRRQGKPPEERRTGASGVCVCVC